MIGTASRSMMGTPTCAVRREIDPPDRFLIFLTAKEAVVALSLPARAQSCVGGWPDFEFEPDRLAITITLTETKCQLAADLFG